MAPHGRDFRGASARSVTVSHTLGD